MPTGGFYTGAQPISGNILSKLFGSKPDVPVVPELDLGTEQQQAINANIAAAPRAGELARISQEQIRDMMRFAIPGFDNLTGQAVGNINSLLRGEIPGDVGQAIKQSGAARSLSGGFGGSGMANNLVARDLGLTSLALTQQGLTSAQSWIGAMEKLYAPSQSLFSSMFITPQQEYAVSSHERDLQFQRSWLVNQISAMPDPAYRGIYDTVMNLANSYLGGSYQGQFKPNYGGAPTTNSGGSWGNWGGSAGYGGGFQNGGAGGGTFDNYIGGAAAGAGFM